MQMTRIVCKWALTLSSGLASLGYANEADPCCCLSNAQRKETLSQRHPWIALKNNFIQPPIMNLPDSCHVLMFFKQNGANFPDLRAAFPSFRPNCARIPQLLRLDGNSFSISIRLDSGTFFSRIFETSKRLDESTFWVGMRNLLDQENCRSPAFDLISNGGAQHASGTGPHTHTLKHTHTHTRTHRHTHTYTPTHTHTHTDTYI